MAYAHGTAHRTPFIGWQIEDAINNPEVHTRASVGKMALSHAHGQIRTNVYQNWRLVTYLVTTGFGDKMIDVERPNYPFV